jgi:hypothetical protein
MENLNQGGWVGWDMMTLMGERVVHAKSWSGNLKGKGLSERSGRKWEDKITRWMWVWGLSILPVRDYAHLWSMLLKSVIYLLKCRYKAVVPTGICSCVNQNIKILRVSYFHENGSLSLLPHTHCTRPFSRQQKFRRWVISDFTSPSKVARVTLRC